jgi:hypothetical protein
MTAGLLLEFDGMGRESYDAVNERLGIDQETGTATGRRACCFMPVGPGRAAEWASRSGVWEEDQQRFMDARLGRALQEGGITGPASRVEWLDLAAYHSLST